MYPIIRTVIEISVIVSLLAYAYLGMLWVLCKALSTKEPRE